MWGASERTLPTLHRNQAARHHQQKRPTSRPSIPAKVRAALAVRSEGMCEIAEHGCTGTAVDPSHRISTGMGGRKGEAAARHHVLSNLLHACRHCHSEHVHAQPAVAYWNGWMLHEHEDPTAVPVLYRGRRVLLTDHGTTIPFTPEEIP